jgi:hypothetical protein
MINIVTIDPSLISTALTINGKPFSIASEKIALTKKGELTKWFEIVSDHCEVFPVDTEYKNEKKYAQLEVNKIETFQRIANLVRKLVDKHCDSAYNTVCLIEGYSYSSSMGPLIDLVTLGSLIRERLFSRTGTELVVLSPSTVKKMAAKLTYEPIKKGKKVEYRNKQGLAGGSFKKPDIYRVLTENDNIDSDWVRLLRDLESEVLGQKNIPKPIEDINDAVVMFHICEEEYKTTQDFQETTKNLRNT